jgi:hypothetical protein
MAEAWEQFGEIQEANRALRRMQLAREVQQRRYAAVDSLSTGTLLGITAPLHGTLLDADIGRTVQAQKLTSDLPTGLTSPAFRRITRSAGPLARRTGVSLDVSKFATRVETGRVPQLSDGLTFTRDITPRDSLGGALLSADGLTGGGIQSGDDWQAQSLRTDTQETVSQGGSGTPAEDFRPGGSPIPSHSSGSKEGHPFTDLGPVDDGGDVSPPDRPPSIERVQVLLDSIDTHVTSTERELDTLATAVRRDDREAITEAIDTEPTVVERCATIGPATFASLSRRISKLIADHHDLALPPEFTRSRTSGHLQLLHRAQRDLDDAMADTVVRLRSEPPQPRRAQDALDRAKQALSKFKRAASAIRAALESVPAATKPLSGELERDDGDFVDSPTLESIGTASPRRIQMPPKETLRSTILEGIDPAAAIHEHAAEVLGVPELPLREDPVAEVMAAPTFDISTYELLAELNQDYFLPGVSEVPKSSMGVLQTNPEFIEAFMTGLNHEMARELQWRRFPTDRKGTYFRRFWNRAGNPEVDPTDPEAMADIDPIHTWDQNDLGDNSPRDDEATVVVLIRGELLRRYPNTDIFAAKAVADGDSDGEDPDRVPALPGTHVTREDAQTAPNLTFPVFRGTLEPDITFFGFDLTPDEALYDPYHGDGGTEPDDHADEGWFFVLQEPPAETRFGMDVGADKGPDSPPPGITHSGGTTERIDPEETNPDAAEHGWNALSWAHMVSPGERASDVAHVDVTDSRPGTESWAVEANSSYVEGGSHTYTRGEAATWGYNSAHMARVTWQLPVRISIHADDMITEDSAESWRLQTVPGYSVTTVGSGGDQ